MVAYVIEGASQQFADRSSAESYRDRYLPSNAAVREVSTYDRVRCTDQQWGNETMQALAAHHFAQFPDCDFVEVYEHGGWYLGFRRNLSLWSTANDAARLSDCSSFPYGFSGRSMEYPSVA